MSLSRGDSNFHPVSSSEPAFESSALNGPAALYALESTGLSEWQGAGGRSVRIASKKGDDFSVIFGSSDSLATSSGALLTLGGTVEVFALRPSQSHVSVFSSTKVTVSFCLGYGS